jgi:hypothetical protein
MIECPKQYTIFFSFFEYIYCSYSFYSSFNPIGLPVDLAMVTSDPINHPPFDPTENCGETGLFLCLYFVGKARVLVLLII